MLNINGDKVKVWRNDRNGFASYYITISSKNMSGDYDKAYQTVRFRKDVNLDNGVQISIDKAFPTVSKWKDGSAHVVWMISEFHVEGGETYDGYEPFSGLDEEPPF